MDTIHPYISNKIISKRDKRHNVNTKCVHLIEFFNKNVSKMYEKCNTTSVSDAQKTFPPSINVMISHVTFLFWSRLNKCGVYFLVDIWYIIILK